MSTRTIDIENVLNRWQTNNKREHYTDFFIYEEKFFDKWKREKKPFFLFCFSELILVDAQRINKDEEEKEKKRNIQTMCSAKKLISKTDGKWKSFANEWMNENMKKRQLTINTFSMNILYLVINLFVDDFFALLFQVLDE